MRPQVSISELFQVLLPREHPNGWLAMITAYFDDSGTHDHSKMVVVGGIFGTESRMGSLERNWRKHIDRPLCGRKARLSRFHMFDCQASQGEFAGWSRTETDYFCHQLRTVIIESGVVAYGIAVARKDWDELVTGDFRACMGGPEAMCIRNCFVVAIKWVQANSFDPKMTFVFDNRPSIVKRDAAVVSHAFEAWTKNPTIVGTSFLSSLDILPLQAADMVAWELYQNANDLLLEDLKTPRRKELTHLSENMPLHAQIAKRDSIKKIVEFWKKQDPEKIKQMANHFTYFDPENPDYSYLYGRSLS